MLSNIRQRYICTCIHTYIHVCTYTRTCTHIHRPKTDLGTGELKTEEPSTPRRSARLLAKRSQKESPQPSPAENSSGGIGRKKNLFAASVNKEEETASLAPRLRSSRLRSGEKSNRSEHSTSELSATEETTRSESLSGRRKLPAKRTAAVNKRSVSATRVHSPLKKGTKETLDTSEPDRTSRSGRKGKRSSSAALLSTSPPPKRQKSTSKASPRAASVRSSKKKQESDVDSQPGSSRGAQRGKNSQANKTRKTRPVAESTDSEPESSKTRKGKSPAKLKSSPLLTAKEKFEGKASAKGKSRASSSKGKGKAGSAAIAKRSACVTVCVGGGGHERACVVCVGGRHERVC